MKPTTNPNHPNHPNPNHNHPAAKPQIAARKRQRTSALPTLLTLLLILTTQTATTQNFGRGANLPTTPTQRDYYNNTMLGDALIETDPETRSLIIITDDETNTHIQQIIQKLDQPKPQVLIKVVFVEITHRNDLDIGIETTLTLNSEIKTQSMGENTVTTGTGLDQITSNFGIANLTNPQGGLYQLQLIDNDLALTARAYAQDGKFEILSRPSILARNNQEALITVGNEVPFIRNTQITDTGQQINTIEYEDVGIILRVTPFITTDGLVEMIIAPEISTITEETVPITNNINAPLIAKRSAETVVVTANGQTVVIGGLMERNKTQSTRKIPILGDIPILGWAFRRKINENTKTELLIFLTPHVIHQPHQLQKLTQQETDQTELTPSLLPGEPLNKYLDNADTIIPPTRRQKK